VANVQPAGIRGAARPEVMCVLNVERLRPPLPLGEGRGDDDMKQTQWLKNQATSWYVARARRFARRELKVEYEDIRNDDHLRELLKGWRFREIRRFMVYCLVVIVTAILMFAAIILFVRP
jgi:hypothetical protein